MYNTYEIHYVLARLAIMQVRENKNSSGILSYIQKGDYIIAVNTLSVASFSSSVAVSQWEQQLDKFKIPRLMCFYRNGSNASKPIFANMVRLLFIYYIDKIWKPDKA